MKKIRIGSGAGYAGDRIEPAVELMEKGNLDYMAQTLSQSARTMQQLRQESSLNLQKPLRSWRWFLVL